MKRAVNPDACLPAELRGPDTTITRIAAGLSGAGVYRVEAAGQAFVLKVSDADGPVEAWRRRVRIQQLASDAGLAPRIVHVDDARRAVVSVFVADGSFPELWGNPQTHGAAIDLLGRTIRRVHALPLPPDAPAADARQYLAVTWAALRTGLAVPPFVADAVHRALTQEAPPYEGAAVLSHNDVNPSNLVLDGERLLLLDWDTAGANDPFYDLATVSIFFRMDPAACMRLLAAYQGEPVSALPARFISNRRLVGVLSGALFLNLARQAGHPGITGGETLEATPSLGELYQRMRAGEASLATPEGRWSMGLALIRESASG
jgi:aminoglycoside phosphotransferase (APT) family kinase protein